MIASTAAGGCVRPRCAADRNYRPCRTEQAVLEPRRASSAARSSDEAQCPAMTNLYPPDGLGRPSFAYGLLKPGRPSFTFVKRLPA
jgi:hypothetical protein